MAGAGLLIPGRFDSNSYQEDPPTSQVYIAYCSFLFISSPKWINAGYRDA
jgi:hypothetical protein